MKVEIRRNPIWRASAPYVPIMVGTRTKPWFGDSARHIARDVGDERIRKIAGAGHFGPLTVPDAVADELIHFLRCDVDPTAARSA